MKNPQHELIEQYLDGALPPEARASFEGQLAADPELAGALRLYEVARAAVGMQSLLDRREALYRRGRQKLHWRKWWWKLLDRLEIIFFKQYADGASRIRLGFLAGIGLGGVILLFLFIYPDLINPKAAPRPKPLAVPKEKAIIAFNTYFKRYDLRNTLGANDFDSLYLQARAQYEAADCATALPNLAALVADPQFEYRAMAALLQGNCLLEQGNAPAAIEAFQLVPPKAKGPYQQARWYLALAYLKLEDTEAATAVLREIAAVANHPHQEDAAKILGIE